MADQNKPRLTPEEVAERLGAWQEKRREASATKVTRSDVERKLEEKKQARRQALEEKRARRGFGLVSLGLSVALLAGAGGVAMVTMNNSASYELERETNHAEIVSLKSQLAEMPVKPDETPEAYEAVVLEQIEQATVKAREVAELQQGFSEILLNGDMASSDNGAPSPAAMASVEHRKLLAPYFTEASLVAEDVDAYAPRSALPFDSDEIDPRFPWFVGQSVWQVASVMPSADEGVFEVTWLNQNEQGDELYAWAQARYLASEGTFAKLTVGVTALGAPDTNEGGQ